jgi:hypothetical protein
VLLEFKSLLIGAMPAMHTIFISFSFTCEPARCATALTIKGCWS